MSNLKQIKMEKIRALRAYLAKWSHLPMQGTIDWKANRVHKVGGSELYDAVHSKKKLIKSKLGLTSMPNTYNLVFGHVFERVTRVLCQVKYRCIIFEGPGSIPSAECPDDKTYSMDGIGVVEYEDGVKITLFEFKNTVTRKIIYNTIPKKYIPQVKSGLSDIEIAERALYIETSTKICNEQYEIASENPRVARGFIAVYADAADYSNVDFYALPRADLTIILTRIHAGEYNAWLSPIELAGVVIDLDKSREEITKYCKDAKKHLIGFIYYVVDEINTVQVEPEPGYTQSHAEVLRTVNTEVAEFMAMPEEERAFAFMKRYNERGLDKITQMLNMDL